MGHGADLDKIKREYGISGPIIDFSSNINPTMPDGLEEIILENIDYISA